jgi:hypothetical protein
MKLIHCFLFHKKKQAKKAGYGKVEWLGLFRPHSIKKPFSTLSKKIKKFKTFS